MTRVRMDVWRRTQAEGDWPRVLVAYEKAVGLLRQLDPPPGVPANPLGWRYLAAIHGRARADGTPDRSNRAWNQCQHGSWFFLPWHRMYLLAFEAIVQSVLHQPNWSLPYWYSVDPDHPETSVLPPAFRDLTAGNNLYTPHRSRPANRGRQLPSLAQELTDALEARRFSTANGITSFGSGERGRPSFEGHENGLLEDTPHGGVHVYVGNDYDAQGNLVRAGWMGSLYESALDPIFWLHHANMDRMWEIWLESDPGHRNPPSTDRAWLNTQFTFPKPDGGTVSWRIRDVLDMSALGYTYEDLSAPSTVQTKSRQPQQFAVAAGAPEPVVALASTPAGAASDVSSDPSSDVVENDGAPETVGATADIPLSSDAPAIVELHAATRRAQLRTSAASGPPRTYLRLERITGSVGAPVYEVYVNVPDGEEPERHPELLAGRISTFGLVESSTRNGPGLTKVLDITRVRATLEAANRWDPSRVSVRFRPHVPEPDPEDAAEPAARRADLRVGQLSIVVA